MAKQTRKRTRRRPDIKPALKHQLVVGLEELSRLVNDLGAAVSDPLSRVRQTSPFTVVRLLENGRPLFADGSTTCMVCNALRFVQHLSPRGLCDACIRAEWSALLKGETSEKWLRKTDPRIAA